MVAFFYGLLGGEAQGQGMSLIQTLCITSC
jgi:hypothetical protein